MNVGLVTPEFLPTRGGVGAYAYYLARGLRDRAEVRVLTRQGQDNGGNGFDLEGVEIHPVPPSRTPRPRFPNLRFQWAVRQTLPDLIRTHDLDVVHLNHAYMSDLLTPPPENGTARVLTVHTTLGTQMEGTQEAGSASPSEGLERNLVRFRPLLLPLERRYLRGVSHMIFVSRWVRERARAGYDVAPRNSAVVPNGVDLNLFSPLATDGGRGPTDGEPPVILFAGRLMALKGLATLLKAAARLKEEFRLVLAGPGDVDEWQAYAGRLGLGPDRCRFLGRVPYHAMPSLYRSAQVAVLPSFAESYPMFALEAMASGTPLVATSVGGLEEMVADGETGWLVPAGDPESLASRMGFVLAHPDEAARVAQRARRWVEGHASLKTMADETRAFYRRALEEGDA